MGSCEDREVLIEANIPAAQPPAAADARISEADENRDGSEGTESAAREGSSSAHRLDPPAREGRLRTHKDFQNLYEHGRALRGDLLVLIMLPSGRENARFGVVASRKVGSAVVRNRCKRVLREAARALARAHDLSGTDLLLIARPSCRGARLDRARDELDRLYISLRNRGVPPAPRAGEEAQ